MKRPRHEPPRTPEEVERWAWEREPEEREDHPRPGEHVLVRTEEWAEPVPAVVIEVQDIVRPNDGHGSHYAPDPNVWHPVTGDLHPDPWPWVTVRLGHDPGSGREMKVKEARVRGSAGWLRPGSRWHQLWPKKEQ
jgi:hypothetical protein